MKKKKKEIREVTKPMAFCTDVDGLAAEVMTQRGLDPARTKIQIGIDDGGLNTMLYSFYIMATSFQIKIS